MVIDGINVCRHILQCKINEVKRCEAMYSSECCNKPWVRMWRGIATDLLYLHSWLFALPDCLYFTCDSSEFPWQKKMLSNFQMLSGTAKYMCYVMCNVMNMATFLWIWRHLVWRNENIVWYQGTLLFLFIKNIWLNIAWTLPSVKCVFSSTFSSQCVSHYF